MRWIAWCILVGEAWLDTSVDFCKSGHSLEHSLEMVEVLIPVIEAMEQIECLHQAGRGWCSFE